MTSVRSDNCLCSFSFPFWTLLFCNKIGKRNEKEGRKEKVVGEKKNYFGKNEGCSSLPIYFSLLSFPLTSLEKDYKSVSEINKSVLKSVEPLFK